MTIYNEENISELEKLGKKIRGNRSESEFPFNYWNKIKKDLQVHTKGKIYEKTFTVFNNEEPSASSFVLNTYEPVTKGSIWKGIDNISRIFKNTGFDISTDEDTQRFISESGIKSKIIDRFINLSMSTDPNTFAVPILKEDGNWDIEFIESEFVTSIDSDSICFIDVRKSKYGVELEKYEFLNKLRSFDYKANVLKDECLLMTYPKKVFNYKSVHYVYISKSQYIEAEYKDGKFKSYTFNDLPEGIKPYVSTGVNKEFKFVSESPVSPFVSFGNIALMQHRASRSVENIFGYPRMSEIELPCDDCSITPGKVKCEISDEHPSGEKACSKCHGTGSLSLQSIFKIYKKRLSPDYPELNVDVDPVKFHTPDVGILDYVSKAWKDSLRLGEDAIYVQQVVETGSIQSAKSREKQLEQMYSWLDRLSSFFYASATDIINNLCVLNGFGKVTIEKPVSFAILNELESFDYLNAIVNSNSPIFIKTVHIENFLKKYISSSNPIIRVVEILKKIDLFCFYSMEDLQKMSNTSVIDDVDWRIHAYAFPILSRMYAMNPELLKLDDDKIIQMINEELGKKIPKELGSNSQT